MKVILLGEIKGKGGEGDVVDVAQGYAENYLFPKKLAVAATKGNLKQLEERRNNIGEARGRPHCRRQRAQGVHRWQVRYRSTPRSATRACCLAPLLPPWSPMRSRLTSVLRSTVSASSLAKPIKVAGAHEVPVALYREIRATVTVLVGVTAEEAVEEPEAAAEETAEEAVAEVETEAAAE